MNPNSKLALLICTLLLLVATAIGLTQTSQASSSQPLTTLNFVCEIRGELSNEHFDIQSASYLSHGAWAIQYIAYREEITEIYIQRPGEYCHPETYAHESPSPRGTGLASPVPAAASAKQQARLAR